MTPEQLKEVRAWARAKIRAGQEPPWAWYQYMKLDETLTAIIEGMGVRSTPAPTGGSPAPDRPSETGQQSQDSATPEDTAVPHRPGLRVILPM